MRTEEHSICKWKAIGNCMNLHLSNSESIKVDAIGCLTTARDVPFSTEWTLIPFWVSCPFDLGNIFSRGLLLKFHESCLSIYDSSP